MMPSTDFFDELNQAQVDINNAITCLLNARDAADPALLSADGKHRLDGVIQQLQYFCDDGLARIAGEVRHAGEVRQRLEV